MAVMLSIIFPLICGFAVLPLKKIKNYSVRSAVFVVLQCVQTALGLVVVFGREVTLDSITFAKGLSLSFTSDETAKLFCFIVSAAWLLVTVYATVYMKHEENAHRFYLFSFLTESAMMGAILSDNLVSMYLFYELVTLLSAPLVLHVLSKRAVFAAKKYLYYSIAGAFMALFGIFVLASNASSLDFSPSGNLSEVSPMILTTVFLMCVGFGAKAGLFPLHGWLPSAHPVAPAPASALLSGVIAKAGVLAIIRTVFFIVGADNLSGTWVQRALLLLSVITVLMGSMMAYKERVFKKRLAYSTVSQISYVLTALFLFTPEGFEGALWQIVFHAAVKVGLFLCAGAVIFLYGKTDTEELDGIGRKMPVTFVTFTVLSLSLIGIPPSGGFYTKWKIATAALGTEGIGAFSYIIPVILLVSALLTAGYLLSVVIKAFWESEKTKENKVKEPILMLLPLIILSLLALFGGVFLANTESVFSAVTSSVF